MLKNLSFGVSGCRTTEQAEAAKCFIDGLLESLPAGSLQVWTDGSKLGRGTDGPTGAGALIHYTGDSDPSYKLSYHLGTSTNQVAEIWAIGGALEQLEELGGVMGRLIHIFTDSKFTINCLTGVYQTHKHYSLTKLVLMLIRQLNIPPTNFHHVPGHVGIAKNEEADDLAKAGAQFSKDNNETFNLHSIATDYGFNHLKLEGNFFNHADDADYCAS